MGELWHPRPQSKVAQSVQNNFGHQFPWKITQNWPVNSLRSFIQKHPLKYKRWSLLAFGSLLRQSPVEGWHSSVPPHCVLLYVLLPSRTELRACIRQHKYKFRLSLSPRADHHALAENVPSRKMQTLNIYKKRAQNGYVCAIKMNITDGFD